MPSIKDWQQRWGIPQAALDDILSAACPCPASTDSHGSEASTLVNQRLTESKRGNRVWRNNVGAGTLDNGSFMRWGLANDSPSVNARIKSADLIGISPMVITPTMIGSTIGQFTSIECKRPGWRYTGTEREQAQLRWAVLVLSMGGRAEIIS